MHLFMYIGSIMSVVLPIGEGYYKIGSAIFIVCFNFYVMKVYTFEFICETRLKYLYFIILSMFQLKYKANLPLDHILKIFLLFSSHWNNTSHLNIVILPFWKCLHLLISIFFFLCYERIYKNIILLNIFCPSWEY